MTDCAVNTKMSAAADNDILKLETDESSNGIQFTNTCTSVTEYNTGEPLDLPDTNLTNTSGAIETQSVEYKYTENPESMYLKTEVYTEDHVDCDPEHVLSVFPFVCGICDIKVKSIFTYLAHFQIHDHVNKYLHCCYEEDNETDIEDIHVYSCGACGLKYPSLCTLYKHLVTDEGVLDFDFLGDKKEACIPNGRSKHQPDQRNYERDESVCNTDQVYSDRVIDIEYDIAVDAINYGESRTETEASSVPKGSFKRKRKLDRKVYKTPDTYFSKNSEKNCKVMKKEKPRGKNSKVVREAKNNSRDKNSTVVRKTKSNSDNNSTMVKEAKISNPDNDNNVTEVKGDKITKREGNVEKSDAETKTKYKSGKVKKKGLLGEEFPCETCGKIFKYRTLMRHRETHEKHIFPCDLCDLKFKSKSSVQGHKAHVHATDKKFTCDECGKSFKALSYLRQHSQTHLKEANVQCPVCGRMFLYKNILRIHLLTHSENRRHFCNICGKGFKRQHAVTIHKEGVHEAVEKYPCTDCDRMFITKDRLRKHRLVHQPPKFSCQFCAKTFRTNSNMRIHLKVHRETK